MKSKTQYAILGALSIQPMSGYEIKKMMAGSTNYFWSESNGQLYPTLIKLAKANLIILETQLVGAKLRKVYSLSASGKKKLQQWLLKKPEYYSARNELLLKIFYGKNVSASVSIDHICNHQKQCAARLAIFKNIEERLEDLLKQKKSSVYFLLTVKAGIKIVQSELDWCKESIQLIRKYA